MTGADLPAYSFPLYSFNRLWFNTTTLRRRNFDGQIVSTHQSGSHWLKYMLSHVLAMAFDLPPPEHIQDDKIIGHPKSPTRYKNVPCIVHSHSIPHGFLKNGIADKFLRFPRYLVLLRDPRESLISHYERFKGDYGNVDFTTYLHGDPRGKKFYSDLWTRLCFMNAWGDILRSQPQRSLLLTYEGMEKDTEGNLRRTCSFFFPNLDVQDDVIRRTLELSTRDKMAKNPNKAVTTTVIRKNKKPLAEYFTPENEEFFRAACRKFLRHDFGYDLK